MARTLPLIEFNEQNKAEINRKITCSVMGQMSDGSMVWKEEGRTEQYQCIKLNGRLFFILLAVD